MKAPLQILLELLKGVLEAQLSTFYFLGSKLIELWNSLLLITALGGFWVAIFVSFFFATVLVLALKFLKSNLKILIILFLLVVLLLLLLARF